MINNVSNSAKKTLAQNVVTPAKKQAATAAKTVTAPIKNEEAKVTKAAVKTAHSLPAHAGKVLNKLA